MKKYIALIIVFIAVISAYFVFDDDSDVQASAESFQVEITASQNEVTYGDTITLSVQATPSEAYDNEYHWLKNDTYGGWIEVGNAQILELKSVADSGDYKCKVKFIFNGETQNTLTSSGKNVRIVPKEITVFIQDKVSVYGSNELDLNWSTGYGDILGGDDLNVELYRTQGKDVGVYDINGRYNNIDYLVNFSKGEYKILPRTLELDYILNSKLVYDGTQKTIEVVPTNVLDGDEVNLEIEGNTATEIGRYELIVKSVDNSNYELPSGGLIRSFAINNPELISDDGKIKVSCDNGFMPESKLSVGEGVDEYLKAPTFQKALISKEIHQAYNDVLMPISSTVTVTFCDFGIRFDRNTVAYLYSGGMLTKLDHEIDLNGDLVVYTDKMGIILITKNYMPDWLKWTLCGIGGALFLGAITVSIILLIKKKHNYN